MTVTLLSNIPHYHYLARALNESGLLRRYITSNSLFEDEAPPRWLSQHWQRKLEGRRLPALPRDRVTQIRLPELLQRGLPMLGAISAERGNYLNNHLFDRLAVRWVDDCQILHFVSSIGLYCARRVKARGGIVVCDARQEHPAFQRKILQEEAELFKLPVVVAGSTYEDKVLEELAIADYIFVPSQHARNTYLAEGFQSDRLITLPFGVDLEHFTPMPTRRSGFRVLYVGAITLRKGVQYLLEAFKQARLSGGELLMVGPMDPSFRPVLERYEGLFTYQPAVPKTSLRDLYSSASVFVLPSLADSFSLATIEAMACACPVIISENTGAADVLTDGREGFVLPIRDVDALVDKLRYLSQEPDEREAMGLSARQTAIAQTWERYGQAAVEFYQQRIALGAAYV